MDLTFLAAADLHLGKASSGAKRNATVSFSWAPQPISAASATAAWFRIVETAIDRKVNAVLLAGDLVDRDNHFFEARSALLSGFNRLAAFDIPAVVVAGNHDAQVLPEVLATNNLPNVHLLGPSGKWTEKVLRFGEHNIGFVGWSFPGQHARFDPFAKFDLPPAAHPRVGLLHCDFGVTQSLYGPVSQSSLQHGDVSCWVLGHIHKPMQVSNIPLSFYPGSPQALSAKEQGAHGCVLIHMNDISLEDIVLSSVIYESLEVNLTGCASNLDAQVRLLDELNRLIDVSDETTQERIIDLVWTGELENPAAASDWLPDPPGLMNDVQVTIRTVSNQCTIPLPDLKELASEAGPVSVLANAILDLTEGRNTPFLKRLKDSATVEVRKLNSQTSFGPIRKDGVLQESDSVELDKMLIHECRALLSSLILTRRTEG
ncbi:MAG: metallophosphoesterase [Bacteroidetes bacterium]|nr:metallophosphoesterase [Bacteroidota bacterium]MCH8523029.1 metallophosphoesterase [Balneolales bacterium]